MSSISDLITRNYTNFRGVDFRDNIIQSFRSPDSLNMWKSYSSDTSIETRPGMKLLNKFYNEIFGLFFYKVQDYTHVLVHSGVKMLEWENYPNTPAITKVLYMGLNPKESKSFIFDNIFFFLDGINYLEFDGVTMKKVEGTIPITTYYRTPDGLTNISEETDTDLIYQHVNVLTPLKKNAFIGDGKSKDYYLDSQDLDNPSSFLMEAYIDNVPLTENIGFTVNREKGIVTFKEAPTKDSKVLITYSKTTPNHKERIPQCNLLCEFDNRIFFSGNKDHPNAVFHSELNDPRYIRDTAYYECGLDLAKVKALIPGNNALWVIKEINQNSSSIYYMSPTVDSMYGKIYPTINGSVTLGCVSTGINFNDDIVYFSKLGLEGVQNSSLYSEQLIGHRSSNVDVKMTNEPGYENMKLAEYNGYLLCLVNSHIYLADSRSKYQSENNSIEYEWFYWELPNEITFVKEYRGELFLGSPEGHLFKLQSVSYEETIESYWTTYKDNFGYPSYTKTTNKRGNIIKLKNMENNDIHIDTVVDGILKEKVIGSDEKGYIPFRIKDKKFREIQLKISSNKPFGLFSCTMQGFVAGYIKR